MTEVIETKPYPTPDEIAALAAEALDDVKGKDIVVFYQPASKFDTRYGSIGFNEDALHDDGAMCATAFAVIEVTDEVEAALRDLVHRAAG